MGTRSITAVLDESGNELVTIYGQWDGYPAGHGADLKACCPTELVNGIRGDKQEKTANGMGCLAATVVGGLKQGIGGVYLIPTGKRYMSEEYIYTLSPEPAKPLSILERGKVMLRVEYATTLSNLGKSTDIYEGPIKDFEPSSMKAA